MTPCPSPAFRPLPARRPPEFLVVLAAVHAAVLALVAGPPGPMGDWLVNKTPGRAVVRVDATGRELTLENGLVRRTFRLNPNAATVALDNRMTGTSLIRAVEPEAGLTIDGQDYPVGGLWGQVEKAYLLPAWLDALTNHPTAFVCTGFTTGTPPARLEWKRVRHAADLPWPPPGVSVEFTFAPSAAGPAGVRVTVHYELYDGLPLLAKWLTVSNASDRAISVDGVTVERLACVEAESDVEKTDFKDWRRPRFELFADYSFHNGELGGANRTVTWLADPTYTSQVNYRLQTPALVVNRSPVGPAQVVPPGMAFESFRSFLLVYDSDDRERQGLALRRALRTLAPWCTENPIMMHVRDSDPASFRLAVDQCAEVGFEMLIYTFGSGLNMESSNPLYVERVKADVDYAHAQGLQVGAYSLFSSRSINPDQDVINPKTGKPGGAIFDQAPCLASAWGTNYLRQLRDFIEATGLDLLEHDGPYPGDVCASTSHPGHRGEADSQWAQWRLSADFYAWCRARGVYVNQPDFYFLVGGSKTAMGYREVNWSLPRERQILLARQNIFDGTWAKTPTMGWMFVPLTEYHGGGAAATIEPLREHLADYEAHLINNFASGVQACYRGPRLFDSDETRAVVKRWVDWFKRHRGILESDIIHVRRADGRDIDCLLHVNPQLKERALAAVWNPLDTPVERQLRLPLYYAGITDHARIRIEDGKPRRMKVDRNYKVDVAIRVPARGFTWVVVE